MDARRRGGYAAAMHPLGSRLHLLLVAALGAGCAEPPPAESPAEVTPTPSPPARPATPALMPLPLHAAAPSPWGRLVGNVRVRSAAGVTVAFDAIKYPPVGARGPLHAYFRLDGQVASRWLGDFAVSGSRAGEI
ncbi:MAG: hypothetical protein HY744_11865 [Deltaproteobacteria bacterium]|nr:hypothetical protein [Deltaproteobacteria bacterium]